jgi:DMSO reductase anchor subunit
MYVYIHTDTQEGHVLTSESLGDALMRELHRIYILHKLCYYDNNRLSILLTHWHSLSLCISVCLYICTCINTYEKVLFFKYLIFSISFYEKHLGTSLF